MFLIKSSYSFAFARRASQGGLSQGKLSFGLLSSSLFSSTSSDTSSASSTSTSGSSVNKLDLLREYMSREGLDAFIVPTDDPHMSEYCASYYARREYISGFTGSAGTAVITMDNALLFTDGRYHDQAELELDNEKWTLMKSGIEGVPSIQDYLIQNLDKTGTIGLDPDVHCANNVKKLEQRFAKDSKQLKVKMLPSNHNPVDEVNFNPNPNPNRCSLSLNYHLHDGDDQYTNAISALCAFYPYSYTHTHLPYLDLESRWLSPTPPMSSGCHPHTS